MSTNEFLFSLVLSIPLVYPSRWINFSHQARIRLEPIFRSTTPSSPAHTLFIAKNLIQKCLRLDTQDSQHQIEKTSFALLQIIHIRIFNRLKFSTYPVSFSVFDSFHLLIFTTIDLEKRGI